MSLFGGKLTVKVKNCSIMFDNQMYLIIIWQLLPVSANFYLVFLFGVFDRLFDKIIDFEWSNAPLDWEIKFWNFIFPSHELIIDLEIVIRSFFDIAQIHQRSKGKIEPKYPHSPKYTHNTLCKRQVPFLTFSHPEQWFRCDMKISKFFNNHAIDDENFYRIWNLTNKIGVFNLLQMTKYWLGTTRKAKAAEVKTGNQIDKIKLQMHPDLKSLSVIQFMFL